MSNDQTTSDAAWDRIKDKYPTNPTSSKPPEKLDPALLNAAVADAKAVRTAALENAKVALEEAFGEKYKTMIGEKMKSEKELHAGAFLDEKTFQESFPKKNVIQQKVKEQAESDDIIEANIDELITELEGKFSNSEAPKTSTVDKRFEETRDLIKNFRQKVAKYPKHLSYEGSMVLCVMLSMKETVHPTLSNLPSVDQTLIRTLVPSKFLGDLDYFSVSFDDNKDFDMKFSCRSETEPYLMTMFNSVAHPRPEDLKDLGAGVVPIEKDGDKIAVGGKILLNKKGIKRLIGMEPLKRDSKQSDHDEEPYPRRQPVAGRNAYEIRADVLQMAVDWASQGDEKLTDNEVVDLAKKFYQFVENKR